MKDVEESAEKPSHIYDNIRSILNELMEERERHEAEL